jgi:hypothetical protein
MERSRKSGPFAVAATPSPIDTEQDVDLERDLVLLLSKLDQFRSRLADAQVQCRASLALQIILTMLDEVTDFTEQSLKTREDAKEGQEQLAQAGELYLVVQELLKQLTPGALQSFISFFGKPATDHGKLSHDFRQVTRRLVKVLEGFFVLFQDYFQVPASSTEWNEAHRLFLADLGPVIDRLQC